MWYGGVSVYYWRDDIGKVHKIEQSDGGEQGDALMPGLFCLNPHPQRAQTLIGSTGNTSSEEQWALD